MADLLVDNPSLKENLGNSWRRVPQRGKKGPRLAYPIGSEAREKIVDPQSQRRENSNMIRVNCNNYFTRKLKNLYSGEKKNKQREKEGRKEYLPIVRRAHSPIRKTNCSSKANKERIRGTTKKFERQTRKPRQLKNP